MDSLLTAQPQITIDTVLDDRSVPSEIRNAAGAVLAEMVYEAGGIDAVRDYLQTPGLGIRNVLGRLLKRPWPEIASAWRARPIARFVRWLHPVERSCCRTRVRAESLDQVTFLPTRNHATPPCVRS